MEEKTIPFVSIIAPCRNESNFIEEVVKSVLDGDYPEDKIELLVIDGMSNDGTRDKVANMVHKDARIHLLDNPNKIVPTAMNIGIKKAIGEYIIRIDCHCHFSPDYVRKCIEVAQRTNADNVGGYIKTLPGGQSGTAKAIALATSSKFGVGNSAFRIGGKESEVDTVPFGTYKKNIFEKIGYYDERLVRNQDIELNSRIRKKGGKIIISPEIELEYYNRATYTGLWQQSFNNGLWNLYTIWLTGGGLKLRHFIPMFFLISIVLFSMLSILNTHFLLLLVSDLLLYLSAAIYFAIVSGVKKNISIIQILLAYFVLHFAYGIGSLSGVFTVFFRYPNRESKGVGEAIVDRL